MHPASLHQDSLQGDQVCDGDNLEFRPTALDPYGDQNMILHPASLHQDSLQGDQVCDGDNFLDSQLAPRQLAQG